MRRGLAALLLALLAVTPAQAGRLQPVNMLPMATRSAGDYGPFTVTVPTGVIGLEIDLDLTEASGTLPALSTTLEGSVDGGSTWMPAGSFSRLAGPKVLDRTGAVQTRAGAGFSGGPFWSDTANNQRRLRATATLGGPLRFALRATSITP